MADRAVAEQHLAVLERTDLDLLPYITAFTQERGLHAELWTQMQSGELWIADRNFCIRQAIVEAAARGACVLLRKHGQMPFTALTATDVYTQSDRHPRRGPARSARRRDRSQA